VKYTIGNSSERKHFYGKFQRILIKHTKIFVIQYIPFQNEIKFCSFLHPFSLQIASEMETVVKFFHSRLLETDAGIRCDLFLHMNL
jgi:hypothetical protein